MLKNRENEYVIRKGCKASKNRNTKQNEYCAERGKKQIRNHVKEVKEEKLVNHV